MQSLRLMQTYSFEYCLITNTYLATSTVKAHHNYKSTTQDNRRNDI